MKKIFSIFVIFLCTTLLALQGISVKAQNSNQFVPTSFHRGSLLVGISEGSTGAIYTTKEMTPNSENTTLVKRGGTFGCRDPLFIEYGISNHWGLGLSSGKDIFTINPSDYYGFKVAENKPIQANTDEFTFDASYHVFSNKRLDLAVFTNIGAFSVYFKGQDGDANPYQYKANGNIIRLGTRARYYFFKHFGVVGMISTYAGHASPKDVKDNSVAKTYNTNISGFAIETGLCYRFFK